MGAHPLFTTSRPQGFRSAPRTRPAGQALLRDPQGYPCFSSETQAECNARAARVQALTNPPRTTTPAPAPAPSQVTSMSPQAQAALFNAVGSALGTAGNVIRDAILAGNQLEIARINGRVQTELAEIQASAARAAAQGNQLLAQQQAEQASLLQQFLLMNRPAAQDNTTLFVVGGVVLVGALAAVLLLRK